MLLAKACKAWEGGAGRVRLNNLLVELENGAKVGVGGGSNEALLHAVELLEKVQLHATLLEPDADSARRDAKVQKYLTS